MTIQELFQQKSQARKLFFSTHMGRKQVSMLLENDGEGELLLKEVGGYIGVKERSEPRGALEWYYHGPDLLKLCETIKHGLNRYQRFLVAKWIGEL